MAGVTAGVILMTPNDDVEETTTTTTITTTTVATTTTIQSTTTINSSTSGQGGENPPEDTTPTTTTTTTTTTGSQGSQNPPEDPPCTHAEVVIDPEVPATCTSTGLTEGKHCSECGDVLVEQEEIDKLPHTEAAIPAVPATCESAGLTEGKHCSVCNEIIVAQQVVSKVNCVEGAWIVDKKATTTASGTKHTECIVCGTKISEEVVPMLTYSENLVFSLNDDEKSYYVASIGTETDTNIIIPDTYNGLPVTEIGWHAFEDCTSLESITIPVSITYMGGNAFAGCTALKDVYYRGEVEDWLKIIFCVPLSNPISCGANLYFNGELVKEIEIPDTVTEIPEKSFYNCASLTSVTISNSVTSIGYAAFCNCTSLTSIEIPESVTSIGDSAFEGCTSIDTVLFSGNSQLTDVGDDVFKNCPITDATIPTTALTIPKGKLISIKITSGSQIEDWTFQGCTTLKSVEISNSVTDIGYGTFLGCTSLESIEIPDFVTSIQGNTFSGCTSLISVEIPDSVISIDYSAFLNCISLENIDIPNSVVSIGDSAFKGCSSLTSFEIPESVQSISYSAFRGCTSLISIVIADSITNIDNYSFYGCPITDATIPTVAISAIPKEKLTTVKIIGGTDIPSNAFADCTSLTSIEIPDSVTSIGYSAFKGCSSLESIEIPDSVTSIGHWAFNNCDSLISVIIGENSQLKSIGDYVFDGCNSFSYTMYDNALYLGNENNPYILLIEAENTNIISCEMHKDSKRILDYAFYNCALLESVTFGDDNQMTSIGEWAFYGCASLKDVYYEGSVDEWLGISFGNAPSNPTFNGANLYFEGDLVTNLVIPNSVTSICAYAFHNCTSLTSIEIPKGVTSIGNEAFYKCLSLTSINVDDDNQDYQSINGNLYSKDGTKLIQYAIAKSDTSFVIPSSVTSIGPFAFYYCSSLENVEIPEGVADIGQYAFFFCNSLTSIEVPSSVMSIDDGAFYDCQLLESVTFAENSQLTNIGGGAFQNCISLTSINFDARIEQWNAIEKGSDWNSNTGSYTIYCTDGEIAKDGTVTYYSVGLEFALNADEQGYTVTDNGTCTDIDLIIPRQYNGLPVTGIGNQALNFSSFESIKIPDSVTSIDFGAFAYCQSLKRVIIGKSVSSIGDAAFGVCVSLESIEVDADNQYFQTIDGNLYSKDGKTLVMYAIGKKATSFVISNSVESIGNGSFACSKYLESIKIPDSVTSIGDHTFNSCKKLESVEIGNSVEIIGDYAFRACTSLASIEILDSVTSIGSSAFSSCDSLTSIEIPDSVTSIGSFAFSSCASLTSIEVDTNNQYYKSIDGNLYTKDGGTLIQYAVGKEVPSFTIPDAVVSIGDSAFAYCESLASIYIPSSVTSIGNYAFGYCTSLVSIDFEGTVEQWNAISKDNYCDSNTGSYTIYCTDGEIAKDGTVTYY